MVKACVVILFSLARSHLFSLYLQYCPWNGWKSKNILMDGLFALFFDSHLVALENEIVRHSIGDSCNGARIVGAPHQFIHTYKVGSLTNRLDSRREWVELAIV